LEGEWGHVLDIIIGEDDMTIDDTSYLLYYVGEALCCFSRDIGFKARTLANA
jgi:hypothetical protein